MKEKIEIEIEKKIHERNVLILMFASILTIVTFAYRQNIEEYIDPLLPYTAIMGGLLVFYYGQYLIKGKQRDLFSVTVFLFILLFFILALYFTPYYH